MKETNKDLRHREGNERQNEDREREGRPSLIPYHFTMSNVNRELIPPGYEWGWLAITIHGQNQRNSMEQSYWDGWRPVLRSKYPQLSLPDELEKYLPKSENTPHSDCIIDRGRMLCEIKIEDYERIQNRSKIRAAEQYERVQRGQEGQNDPSGAFIGLRADMNRRYESGGVMSTGPTFHEGSVANTFGK